MKVHYLHESSADPRIRNMYTRCGQYVPGHATLRGTRIMTARRTTGDPAGVTCKACLKGLAKASR